MYKSVSRISKFLDMFRSIRIHYELLLKDQNSYTPPLHHHRDLAKGFQWSRDTS